MSGFEYVRPEDPQKYYDFCIQLIKNHSLGKPAVEELWHYTTADGLIAILETGKIWSTQITCLNDSMESRYFNALVHEAVKAFRAQNTDQHLEVMLRMADTALSETDFATYGRFVTCFSEVGDDL